MYMFQTFLSNIWRCIGDLIDLLKDPAIADYMFAGVSLWVILITFFAGWIVIRFFINSFGGGSGFLGYLGSRRGGGDNG